MAPEETAKRLIRSARVAREPARRVLERFSLIASATATALALDPATERASTPCGNSSFTSEKIRGSCSLKNPAGLAQEAHCISDPLAGAFAFVLQRR